MTEETPSAPPGTKKEGPLLIVGGGVEGRVIARAFAGTRPVTLLELDAEWAERIARDLPGVRVEAGDGTSALVLERVGAAHADAAVVATRDDEANLACARLLRETFHRPRVVAVVGEGVEADAFRRLGVDVVLRGEAVGRSVLAHLSPHRVSAANIGLGEGELLEVTLLPTSPIVGRPLSAIPSVGWSIGALYRWDELIVPSGSTVPEVGDRAILVAPPDRIQAIADFVAEGAAEFPLRYGARIGLVCGPGADGPWEELFSLLARCPCRDVVVFASYQSSEDLDERLSEARRRGTRVRCLEVERPLLDAARQTEEREIGLLVVPPPPAPAWTERVGFRRTTLAAALDASVAPVLVARRGGGYERVFLSVDGSAEEETVVECAFDVSRTLGLPLAASAVAPPPFIGGAVAATAAGQALRHLNDLATLYRMQIRTSRASGNPVREILRRATPGDLLVVGRLRGRRVSVFHPDAATLVALLAESSVLVFPTERRRDA